MKQQVPLPRQDLEHRKTNTPARLRGPGSVHRGTASCPRGKGHIWSDTCHQAPAQTGAGTPGTEAPLPPLTALSPGSHHRVPGCQECTLMSRNQARKCCRKQLQGGLPCAHFPVPRLRAPECTPQPPGVQAADLSRTARWSGARERRCLCLCGQCRGTQGELPCLSTPCLLPAPRVEQSPGLWLSHTGSGMQKSLTGPQPVARSTTSWCPASPRLNLKACQGAARGHHATDAQVGAAHAASRLLLQGFLFSTSEAEPAILQTKEKWQRAGAWLSTKGILGPKALCFGAHTSGFAPANSEAPFNTQLR